MGALDILQSAKRTVNNELGKLQSLKHVGRWAAIAVIVYLVWLSCLCIVVGFRLLVFFLLFFFF